MIEIKNLQLPADQQPMSLEQFREDGFLQEANRQWFHPLGLAMAMHTDDDGKPIGLSVIMTSDPEGMAFGGFTQAEVDRGMRVCDKQELLAQTRIHNLGWIVQPLKAGGEP